MPRPPAPLPPGPTDPVQREKINRIASNLKLTNALAEVALGIYHELTKDRIAVWLGKKIYAVDALIRRLFLKLDVHSMAGVAGRVGAVLVDPSSR